MYNNNKFTVLLPTIFLGALALGIFLGSYLWSGKGNSSNKSLSKLEEILYYIEKDYVDKVNTDTIVEKSIEQILSNLDPHTSYIPKQDISIVHSQLESGFEGIGVEFQIIEDTIYVVSAISGGPSEQKGIRSGDRIIAVNDSTVAGIGITTEGVFKRLRGKKGTLVVLKIKRPNNPKPINFNIIRDKIPTYTVETAFMAKPDVGFIKVSRFGENTYQEFHEALQKLNQQGMKKLIIDLRDNPGGYLEVSVRMIDELIGGQKLVVYTKGKEKQYNSEYFTSRQGLFENGDLIILINEGSASASEIMSGAIQDHDRGTIVGRRSFGKGLVQRPIELNDGSELRLTISKYYTPSGRCIQKPMGKDYDMDIENRYTHGEFYNKDSIKLNKKEVFHTDKGKVVYGGGGIMPDVFLPRDTTEFTSLLGKLYSKNILREIALNYVAENKASLEKMKASEFEKYFSIQNTVLPTLLKSISKNGIQYQENDLKKSMHLIEINLKAYIAKGVWGNDAFWKIFLLQDKVYLKSQELFDKK